MVRLSRCPKFAKKPALRRIGEGRRAQAVDPEQPGPGWHAGEPEEAAGVAVQVMGECRKRGERRRRSPYRRNLAPKSHLTQTQSLTPFLIRFDRPLM